MSTENQEASPEDQLSERLEELRGVFQGKSWVTRVPGSDQIVRLPVDAVFDFLAEELLENLLSGTFEYDLEEIEDLGTVHKIIPLREPAQNVVPFPDRLRKSAAKDGAPTQSYLFPELFREISELAAHREARDQQQRDAALEREKARKAVMAQCKKKAAQLRAKYGEDIGIEYQTATGDVFWYKPLFDFTD